jgi:hypothetical protein
MDRPIQEVRRSGGKSDTSPHMADTLSGVRAHSLLPWLTAHLRLARARVAPGIIASLPDDCALGQGGNHARCGEEQWFTRSQQVKELAGRRSSAR